MDAWRQAVLYHRTGRNHWVTRLTIWSAVAFFWVLDDRIVCVPHPLVRLDERGRPHAGDEPAVEWVGARIFCWHGTAVPPFIIRHPQWITAQAALRERNAEVRRAMMERMGIERFVAEAGGDLLDQDADAGGERTLRRIPLDGDEPVTAFVVRCPSTQAIYVLRVPPTMRTCREAAAWTFGYDSPDAYAPETET